ncbi:expansin-B6 isoform X3 [Aegilops tauschii subsp. strangulata]|uniref:expansin-B6 isoform X3 n=1 Tax=Aegilops tauschii subsp. strangulata TaxID=200361 RepID=UPI001ABCDFC9|nr:expansin-B6 isoform X3 [Aegilops tauschii subsp. strangulata]
MAKILAINALCASVHALHRHPWGSVRVRDAGGRGADEGAGGVGEPGAVQGWRGVRRLLQGPVPRPRHLLAPRRHRHRHRRVPRRRPLRRRQHALRPQRRRLQQDGRRRRRGAPARPWAAQGDLPKRACARIRTACKYGGKNIAFHVNEGSTSFWLSVLVEFEDGEGDIGSMQLKQANSAKWLDMKHVWGATWCLYGGPTAGPFSVRLTTLSAPKTLTARDVIPRNWTPKGTYSSRLNFDASL